jgi:hypothetical protein
VQSSTLLRSVYRVAVSLRNDRALMDAKHGFRQAHKTD